MKQNSSENKELNLFVFKDDFLNGCYKAVELNLHYYSSVPNKI